MSQQRNNKKCEEAIAHKNACEGKGTAGFEAARDQCARILNQSYDAYVQQIREKIASLPKGSKQWWKLNHQLLNKKCKTTSIPPLKVNGEWILDNIEKANAFADAWTKKAQLPEDHADCIFVGTPAEELNNFCAFRTRFTYNLMRRLDESKATGGDHISAYIIKRIAKVIAAPFTRLCRRLFYKACWPSRWQIHFMGPIYKKASVYNANNYRGNHITSILSKVAEHVIGKHLFAFVQQYAFGTNQ